MKCSDAVVHVKADLEGDLSLQMRQALAEHLRGCERCTGHLRQLECTRRLLRRLPRERMPAHMKHRLLDALHHPAPASA